MAYWIQDFYENLVNLDVMQRIFTDEEKDDLGETIFVVKCENTSGLPFLLGQFETCAEAEKAKLDVFWEWDRYMKKILEEQD